MKVQNDKCLQQIASLDLQKQQGLLSMEAQKEREELQKRMDNWIHLEEICWRWKSHVAWLKKGDRNTIFFP